MFFLSDKFEKIIKLFKPDKPIVVFDLETTGLMISADKIVELGYIKIWPDGRVKKFLERFDPEIKISPEATAVHGIGNADLKNKPKFREMAQQLFDEFNGCYYCGHNILTFDLPLLRREFIRAGFDFNYGTEQIIDTRVIFQRMVRRSLSATYEYYCHKRLENAHTSMGDSEAAAEILLKQLEKYKEARDRRFLKGIHEDFGGDAYIDTTRKFYWRNGEAFFAFSKYRDRPLKEIVAADPKFLRWIIRSDFSEEIKTIVRRALDGKAVGKDKNQPA